VSEKSDFDWALVSCAAVGTILDGKFTSVRVALGAIAPVPYQVESAEAGIEGQPFGEKAAGAMADAILSGVQPLAHNAYKIAISRALIRRCLMKLQG